MTRLKQRVAHKWLTANADKLLEYQRLYCQVLSEALSLTDLIAGRTLVNVEGDGGRDAFRAKQLGLFTCNVKGVDIMAKCEADAAPLIHYLEQGGVYGSLDFSRLLGYSEEQIARYQRLLEMQAELGLPPWGFRPQAGQQRTAGLLEAPPAMVKAITEWAQATKRASAEEEGAPLSQTYVQRLLEKSLEIEPELDVSYGMGREKGAPLLLGLLKKVRAKDWVPLGRNDQVIGWLDNHNVPEDELVELRKVPEPRQRTLIPKWNDAKWEWFQDVTGKLVRYEGDFDPAYNKSLADWGKAFEIVKAKYPHPWRIYRGRVKQVVVSGRGSSTNSSEDGQWQDYVNGGTLRLRLRESSYGAIANTGILLHEIGHVYENNFDLLKIMELDLYGMGHPPFVTQYASKNVSEDFAETFMYYWAKPSYLKSKAPMKYEDMHNRLTGKIASTQTRVASRYLLAKALDTKRWGGFTFEIDRPKGYVKTWDQPDGSVKKYKYPVDYGYFIGHTGEDDEGLDAFVGSDPAGKIESFLKLKPSETDPDELVPDETKFLVGLSPKEREQVMSLYEPENVTEMQEYKDVYALISALTEYRTAKKIAKQTITEDTKVTGWEEFVKTEPIKAVKMDEAFEVETLEGTMQGKANDMLAQGIEGERWVIDADIFDKTYAKAEKVAARYLQVTAREEHYYVWVRKFPQVNWTAFASMDQHANGEGTEVSDDPKESLKMIVWDMGWQKEPLPTNKHHWVWELAAALKVNVRKEYAVGSASRGADY